MNTTVIRRLPTVVFQQLFSKRKENFAVLIRNVGETGIANEVETASKYVTESK